MAFDGLAHRRRTDRPQCATAVQELEVGVDGGRLVEARLVRRAVEVVDGLRLVRHLARHSFDALSEVLLRLLTMGVPGRVVGPAGRDHREITDLDDPALPQLDDIGAPDDLVHLHLVIVAGTDEAPDPGPAQLLLGESHPAADPVQHHLLEALGSLDRVLVELQQPFHVHAQRVVALAADLGLDISYLLGGNRLLLTGEREREVAVLLDDRDDRLAGHVAAADQYVRVIEPAGVQELPPARLRTVEVGREKDLWHSYLSRSTLRISRSKPVTWLRMHSSARSWSPARIACSSSMCSLIASRKPTSRSSTRYQRRRLRLK